MFVRAALNVGNNAAANNRPPGRQAANGKKEVGYDEYPPPAREEMNFFWLYDSLAISNNVFALMPGCIVSRSGTMEIRGKIFIRSGNFLGVAAFKSQGKDEAVCRGAARILEKSAGSAGKGVSQEMAGQVADFEK